VSWIRDPRSYGWLNAGSTAGIYVPGGTITLDGTDYTYNSHPRIWSTSARRTELIARSTVGNVMWDGLLIENAANHPVTTECLTDEIINFTVGWIGSNGSRTNDRDDAIAELMNLPTYYDDTPGGDNTDYGSIDLMYFAMAYDWLYSDMSAAQRLTLRNWVHDVLIPYLKTHSYHWLTGGTAYKQYHNLCHTKLVGELMWGLATCGDDSRGDTLLQDTYYYWVHTLLPIFDATYDSGHPYGGSYYGHMRSAKWTFYAQDALNTTLQSMTGWRTWAPVFMRYYKHANLPNYKYNHSDWEPGLASMGDGRLSENHSILIQNYRTGGSSADAEALQYWIVNDYVPSRTGSAIGYVLSDYWGRWHIWYDPSYTATDYSSDDTAWCVDGTTNVPIFFSRDVWRSASATWCMFSACESNWGDHQCTTNGDFRIFRNGSYLIIDNGRHYTAGGNSGSNADPTYGQTIILGDGMVHGVYTGGQERRLYSSSGYLQNFSYGDTYAYVLGNLDSCPDSGYFPVTYWRRHFIHFKPIGSSTENYVVSLDVINSTNSITKKWICHLPNAPTVSTPSALLDEGLNRLNVKVVWPSGGTLESEAVTARTDGTFITQEASDTPTRLVVSTTAGNYQSFGVIFQATASGTVAPTISAVSSTTGVMIGCVINDANYDRMFLAPYNNAKVGAVTISYTATVVASNSEHVLAGMTSGTVYNQAYNAGTGIWTMTPGGTSFTVDNKGVLRVVV